MKNTNQKEKKMILKPCTLKELAAFYGVSRRTFRKWITPYKEEIGMRVGYLYTIAQVKVIIEKLGVPDGNEMQFPIQKNCSDEAADYVNAAWDFAHAILWKDKTFCEEEITIGKNHLRDFFTIPNKSGTEINLAKRLSAFCQRVVLTRQYLDRNTEYRFILSPSLWLDRNYKYGYAGTLRWFRWICEERKQNRYVREELTVFADLYAEYLRTKSSAEVLNKAGDYFLSKCFVHLFRIFSELITQLNNKTNYSLAA